MAKATYNVTVSLKEEENNKLDLLREAGIMPKAVFRRGLEELLKEKEDNTKVQ